MVKKIKIPKAKRRLSADERRRVIIDAAVPLFASEGFRGVTTRRLARQAGVSEALLYQHFPSKEALYTEVQDSLCQPAEAIKAVIEALRPSTESLVLLLFFLAKVLVESLSINASNELFPRLMLASLLEDGAFARLHMERTVKRVVALMAAFFAAARASGDLVDDGDNTPDDARMWFCHHLLVMVHIYLLPSLSPAAHLADKPKVVDQLMGYMLRGIGLTAKARKQYYDYARLNSVILSWHRDALVTANSEKSASSASADSSDGAKTSESPMALMALKKR